MSASVFERCRPPVLIVGAHRSGTSMLARALDELGLFLGRELDPNHESRFFVELDEWLLRRAGGAWDHPLPLVGLLDVPALRAEALEALRAACERSLVRRHAGRGGAARLASPWGWKDPRTIFTLPLWLELFPEARLVAVTRHGVDVARSLERRATRALGDRTRSPLATPSLGWRLRGALRPPERFLLESARCATLAGSFALWEEYTAEAARRLSAFVGPAIALRYETLLDEPAAMLARVAAFCGLAPAPDAVERVAAGFDPARAFAFRRDAEARAFFETVRDRPSLTSTGYGRRAT